MPFEGEAASHPTAASVARTDAPTCSTHERLGDVAGRVRAAGWDACVVVNEKGMVFGLLRSKELAADAGKRIEEVMRPGPSTFRPHVPILEMAERMIEHDLEVSPITTSDGRLVGLLRRQDAIDAAARDHRAHHD